MSISVSQLEGLSDKLHRLSERLRSDRRPSDTALGESDPLVAEANDCEFLLPSPLTIDTLSATVQKKLDNVAVLLERSRMHEELPPDAQAAAEEENVLMDEDYQGDAAARKEGGDQQSGTAW
jgi:hypothetical protein